MIENLPVRSITFQGLTIEGYSRAAVQSYWRVPELKIGFDLGGSPWSFMGTQVFGITHAHLDHLGALPVYVARRRMMKMEPPTIYLPEVIREKTERMLKAWQMLDRARMACDLVGVTPGDEIELSREHLLTVFETKHTVPSVGYTVWERRKKLKPEYQGLTGDQIRDIRLAGNEVAQETRVPVVCYTGDTTAEALDNYPPAYEAKVLITEVSFFSRKHLPENCKKHGHTHLEDIIKRQDKFKNELIIAGHASNRYHDQQIVRILEKRLPEVLRERFKLWL